MNTDYMSAVNAEDKEKAMITKEFLENHFKFHNKLTIYQGQIPLTITKAWHLHLNGGHHDYDIVEVGIVSLQDDVAKRDPIKEVTNRDTLKYRTGTGAGGI